MKETKTVKQNYIHFKKRLLSANEIKMSKQSFINFLIWVEFFIKNIFNLGLKKNNKQWSDQSFFTFLKLQEKPTGKKERKHKEFGW